MEPNLWVISNTLFVALILLSHTSSLAAGRISRNSSITIGRTHGVEPLNAEEWDPDVPRNYIVLVQRNSLVSTSQLNYESWYKSFLPIETEGQSESRFIHAYSNIISGFVAKLTANEVIEMKNKTGFVHAFPDRIVHLLTTHTPDFLGLQRETPGFWEDSNFGKGVIIGVIDSGITPNHDSFSDKEISIPSPPANWKGVCEFNASDCNNKVIGMRNFVKTEGPYDQGGHGSHTAGTAAGVFVDFANINDMANGTAAGMAPYAHLAIYKACKQNGSCSGADILAGFDSAISDGVDVLSVSLGISAHAFYEDVIAIGSFVAMENGIFVSCAAGNDGPSYSTLSNEAPWILTVGASTVDRAIRTTVTLGSGKKMDGESLYQPSTYNPTSLPLVYPGFTVSDAAFCANGSLNGVNVRGMMVLCDDGNLDVVQKGINVQEAGGAAMIIANFKDEGWTTTASAHVLPTSQVSYSDGLAIKTYINSDSAPTASITFQGTITGVSPAPVIGYFSSRGPNQADPNILKPDIIGPGVNILAAWPFIVGYSNTASPFNIISGTSMATPHLSGIAALLKSVHPDWSPAAIKSAIMTSAYQTGNDGNQILDQTLNIADLFAIGSGHVNPSKANNPGFIYDIDSNDYIAYLCGLQYTDAQVSAIANSQITCSSITSISGAELNYPSFTVFLSATNGYTVQVTRTVTNVGASNSTYTVKISSPLEISLTVTPTQLTFSKTSEKVQFSVSFINNGTGAGFYYQGLLTWVSADEKITVNSPINVGVS